MRHTTYGRITGMVIKEGGRSTGILLYIHVHTHTVCLLMYSRVGTLKREALPG